MEIITKKQANLVFVKSGYFQEHNLLNIHLPDAGILVHRKAGHQEPVLEVKYHKELNNYEITRDDGSVWYVHAESVKLENVVPYDPKPWNTFLPEFLLEINEAMVMDSRDEFQLAHPSELRVIQDAVEELLTIELNPNQYTALVSFAYEHGIASLKRSKLLKNVNKGMFILAAGEFGRWTKRKGKSVRAKSILRKKERELFEKEWIED